MMPTIKLCLHADATYLCIRVKPFKERITGTGQFELHQQSPTALVVEMITDVIVIAGDCRPLVSKRDSVP